MKNYIVPEYINEFFETSDIITESVDIGVGGNVEYSVEHRVNEETAEEYDVGVFSTSVRNLF